MDYTFLECSLTVSIMHYSFAYNLFVAESIFAPSAVRGSLFKGKLSTPFGFPAIFDVMSSSLLLNNALSNSSIKLS